MQKGFATIEIIFVIVIIAVLVTVAVPNAARIIDRVALDYETKRLYSELRYLQAISRVKELKKTGTGREEAANETTTLMEIQPIVREYQILRNEIPITEKHKMLPNIKSLTTPERQISFDNNGKANITSKSIVLTSRFGKPNKIVFDSVGRIRGGRDDD